MSKTKGFKSLKQFTLRSFVYRQKVNKGVWWMPWLTQAMKDVISCDKPRVGANNLLFVDFRMGQLVSLKDCHSYQERELTQGTETS